MGEITLCLGFILVYFVEEMVFACVGDRGHGHHGHGEAKKDGDSESASSSSSDWDFFSPAGLRDFVTVVALSFHAIMEGVAVGLEPDEDNVWQLFAGDSRFPTNTLSSFLDKFSKKIPNFLNQKFFP